MKITSERPRIEQLASPVAKMSALLLDLRSFIKGHQQAIENPDLNHELMVLADSFKQVFQFSGEDIFTAPSITNKPIEDIKFSEEEISQMLINLQASIEQFKSEVLATK